MQPKADNASLAEKVLVARVKSEVRRSSLTAVLTAMISEKHPMSIARTAKALRKNSHCAREFLEELRKLGLVAQVCMSNNWRDRAKMDAMGYGLKTKWLYSLTPLGIQEARTMSSDVRQKTKP